MLKQLFLQGEREQIIGQQQQEMVLLSATCNQLQEINATNENNKYSTAKQ